MNKIKNYMLASYGALILAVGVCEYYGYRLIKNKDLTKKEQIGFFGGMATGLSLCTIGIVGATRDIEKQNKLENDLIK